MTDKIPEVTVAKEGKVAQQWGKRFFYRVEGSKHVLNQRKIVLILAAIIVPVVLISLFFDSAPIETGDETPVKLQGDIYSGKKVDIPLFNGETFYSEEALQKQISSSQHSPGEVQAKKNPYVGLSHISRNKNPKIPPGTFTQATLLSGASNGFVRAEISESVRVNGETLLPSGAILIGSGTSTEERLFVSFKQAVLKDGQVITVEAQACDKSDQIIGLKGSTVGGHALKLGAAVALNFASGLSQGLQEQEVKGGVAVQKSDARNALLNAASTAELEESKELMSDYKSRPIIQEIEMGQQICILFVDNRSD